MIVRLCGENEFIPPGTQPGNEVLRPWLFTDEKKDVDLENVVNPFKDSEPEQTIVIEKESDSEKFDFAKYIPMVFIGIAGLTILKKVLK